MEKILVTGGAGYIGSHTVCQLLNSGYEVVVLDSFERGYSQALEIAKKITGKNIEVLKVDLKNKSELDRCFDKIDNINALIHFAAYKNVGEANSQPGKYFENNIQGTVNLLESAHNKGVRRIVFSSTAATYGNGNGKPMKESDPISPLNAYGHSKASVEWLLKDFSATLGWSAIALRYFNAAGAHPSGELGEDPALTGNVIPLIMQTLIGKRDLFTLYGDNFSTADGSQERDYIHVMDLATAHLAAVVKSQNLNAFKVFNLGTGQATSVRKLIKKSEDISGIKLNYKVGDHRDGDPEILVSDPSLAASELNWKAKFGIDEIIRDQWKWVSTNPNGFER